MNRDNANIIVDNDKFPFFKAYHDQSYIRFHDNRPNVSLEDKGKKTSTSKYEMKNTSGTEIVAYNIDGSLLSGPTSKCDYGVYTAKDELYLVELKGAKYDHACLQINETISQLIENKNIPIKSIHARIVLSRRPFPNVKHTEEARLQRKLNRYKTGTEKLWDVNRYTDNI